MAADAVGGRIESQLLLRGEACGCCCGDGSTADDDGSSDASNRLQAVRTAEVIGAAVEAQQQCCVGDSSCHVAMSHGSSSQVAMLHESNSVVISCEENHDRLDHGRLDVHSISLRSTEKSR